MKNQILISGILWSAFYCIPVLAKASESCALSVDSISQYSGSEIVSDSKIYISPLFEYPVAPEDLPDLQSKSDWLMEHFWDDMDFQSREVVNQLALNDAFRVYAVAMSYASPRKAMASIESLIKSMKGNPAKIIQMTKAAEETLYGQRAEFWSDDIYMPFLKAVLAEKKISDVRRQRYAMQYEMLKNNAIGAKMPMMRLTLRDGRHKDYSPSAPFALIEFGNPDCDDCRFARTKLSMAADLQDMVNDGELEIAFIVADAVPEEQPEILEYLKEYPAEWITGISYGADDRLDLRLTPSFYILGRKGEIIAKNLSVNEAVDRLRDIIASQQKNKK